MIVSQIGEAFVAEYSWLFWVLVFTLFAESWARAWASHHRDEESTSAPSDAQPCDPCP